MLAQAHRLRRSADFSGAIRHGRRCGTRWAVVYVAPAPAGSPGTASWRAGLVVSKVVGNSVVRHRVSRRLRAVLADTMPTLGEPKQVVVRALPAAASAAWEDLARAVGKCLREACR
ncbi:MAG: ribonuclease P protein component [Bifidobacteriaceae bacterium]|jgi:ribonuclease P protein component|nr:ribonuclease P protein component [Bifidobacteriaceae bacterium]